MNYIFKVSGIIGILICFASNLQSQDLPTKVDKGNCYGVAKTPNKYHVQEQKVLVRPAFEQEIVIPAEYKTIKQKVLIESQPTRITIPTTSTDFQSLDKVNQSTSKVAMNLIPVSESTSLCNNDCDEPNGKRYLDGFEELAENIKTKTNRMLEREKFKSTFASGQNVAKGIDEKTLSKAIIEHPKYKMVDQKILVKSEEVKTIVVPAEYKTIRHKTLLEKGGSPKWVEVLCPKSINTVLITQLQLALKARGFYNGELHGILSFDVRNALKIFQQEKELLVGQLDKVTLEALGFNYESINTKK